MSKGKREILFFEPVEKQLIWGNESWTVCAHPHGDCRVREGEYAGLPLSQLWKTYPELFGNPEKKEFPLLVKIIEAKEELSIQVHPDDQYAVVNENSQGKTECWYILDCKENAKIVLGHKAGDRKQLEEMIDSGRWEELFCEVPVAKGDFIRLEPGTVHTIKSGITLLEIQQNSDVTYRIYDYGRLSDGKPRDLHIKQGLEVITVPAPAAADCIVPAAERPVNEQNELVRCDYFTVWEMTVKKEAEIRQEHPFLIVCVISGDGLIDGRRIKAGDHVVLPFGYGKAVLRGDMRLILSAVPGMS